MTCTKNTCQSTQDLIAKLDSPINAPYVRQLIDNAVASLRAEFFGGALTPELAQLQARVQRATHCELLAVFFLLLNIDQAAKQAVYDLDVPATHPKITRFLLDLRRQLVSTFFCTAQTAAEFAQECSDTYCIA